MKKIALVTMFTSLDTEKGGTRFRYLAELLCENGYSVDFIISSFQHWDKAPRNLSNQKEKKFKYNIVCIHEPGYKKNIGYERLKSHSILEKNLKKYFSEHIGYDLVYCAIPPNNTAKVCAEYAKEQGIPFIVDVEDLWPEAMKIKFDIPILNSIVYSSFLRDAKITYQLCDGVIGTSDRYRDEPFLYVNRTIIKETVYVGNEIKKFDFGVKQYVDQIKKKKDEFWITYAGMIGNSYDIKTLIKAGKQLKKQGYDNIKLIIMGMGPQLEELKKYSKYLKCNAEFLGYVSFEKMAAYLSVSDVTINSLKRKAPQSIVSKIADYLAAGKPMINTGSDLEFRNKVKKEKFGINIKAEDAAILSKAILYLYKNKEACKKMGQNARNTAEEQFDRPKAYMKIIYMIQELIGEYDNHIVQKDYK